MNEDYKPRITMVGLKQAKEGFTFVMAEETVECKSCEFSNVCMNLEHGRVYTVTKLRNKLFPCQIHEDGVRVVEVEESLIEAAVEYRVAFPLATISLNPRICAIYCENARLCAPLGLNTNDKCKILEVSEKVDCPLNHHLVRVSLKRELVSP